jgi:hypothetical protein
VQRARAMLRETIDRCCHFEVDHYGTVLGWTPRPKGCGCSTETVRPVRKNRTPAVGCSDWAPEPGEGR